MRADRLSITGGLNLVYCRATIGPDIIITFVRGCTHGTTGINGPIGFNPLRTLASIEPQWHRSPPRGSDLRPAPHTLSPAPRAPRPAPVVRFLAVCALIPLLSGCAGSAPARPTTNLKVMAAASLQDLFREMDRTFESRHPGARVLLSTGASSALRTQIQQGAPADLFASADAQNVDVLEKAGLTRSATLFARNRLVIAVPASNPAHIQSLADIAKSGVRLVMTAPQVPIGHYSRMLLDRVQRSGRFGAGFETKVTHNVVSQQPDVRSLLTQVELGEADAAIVYATDAMAGGARVRAIAIPPNMNITASYKIAILRESQQPATARDYLNLLLSPDGRALLQKRGFISSRTPL